MLSYKLYLYLCDDELGIIRRDGAPGEGTRIWGRTPSTRICRLEGRSLVGSTGGWTAPPLSLFLASSWGRSRGGLFRSVLPLILLLFCRPVEEAAAVHWMSLLFVGIERCG